MMTSIRTLGMLINEERSYRYISPEQERTQDFFQSTVAVHTEPQASPEKLRDNNKSVEMQKKSKVFRVKRPTFYNFNPKKGLAA